MGRRDPLSNARGRWGVRRFVICFFFFNDTATTEIYTLSLHDALPIYHCAQDRRRHAGRRQPPARRRPARSEEHTSELQSPCNLVCRLLLEKKNAAIFGPLSSLIAALVSAQAIIVRRLAPGKTHIASLQ